ncbi:MAG: hypothetical protein J6S63_04310 [Atopobiaceae bacterium]|nr:hypothetical protein [Atopobiaceae bacterium]
MMIKTFTSASANKYLRRLEDEKSLLLSRETTVCTFVRAQGEEVAAPAYDYAATRLRVARIDAVVCKLRHALHAFNVETLLPDSDLTIDEALVVLAQLSGEQRRLDTMRSRQPCTRVTGSRGWGGNSSPVIIEYEYTNYDVAEAERDYQELTDRINDLQLKLDLCNQTVTFDVELQSLDE